MPHKNLSLKVQKPTKKRVKPRKPQVNMASPPPAPTPPPEPDTAPAPAPTTSARGYEQRKGRVLADGSRRGAREVRRLTAYLNRNTAENLSLYCAVYNIPFSEVIEEAVAKYLQQNDRGVAEGRQRMASFTT